MGWDTVSVWAVGQCECVRSVWGYDNVTVTVCEEVCDKEFKTQDD